MRPIADLSLRQKLTLISVVPAMAGLLVFLAATVVHDRQIYRNILENDLTSAAHMLAFNSIALLEFEQDPMGIKPRDGLKLLEAASAHNDVDYACIFDRNDQLFSEFVRSDATDPPRPAAPRTSGAYFEPNGVAVYYPITSHGESLGTVYLHSTLEKYNGLLRQKVVTIAILLLVAGGLTVLLALRIQRLIYDPIVQLAGAARTISRTNDYSLRVVRHSNDELGDLVEQFNRMLHRVHEKNNALKNEILVRQAAEQQIAASNEELLFEINQRIQGEEQLGVLLANLEKKNDELQDFAYIVSHDLKAPLRGINSLATWLTKDYGDQLDEKGRRYLTQLRERSRRMHTMIEGILLYSRLGRASISLELLNTRHLVKQAIEMLAPNEQIHIHIDQHLPMVYYDKIMLLQVFQNLIGNAVQHMGKPTGDIFVSCKAQAAEWEFSVRDTGKGIDAKHFERIFRIFQSLKTGTDVESSGIGLALVKKIIERNHGQIRVESTPGEGATFLFTIRNRDEHMDRFGTMNIVIVDANTEYARVTRKLLENFGHHVNIATEWDAAAAFFARPESPVDLVLWDPDQLETPIETMLNHIQAHHPNALIIACTIRDRMQSERLSALPGVMGAIYKPFTMEKLNAILTTGAYESSPG